MDIELEVLIASQLHENSRKDCLNEDGSYEPRWKKVEDEKFIAKHLEGKLPTNLRWNENNELEIDIANTPYEELSADWQKENKEAGIVIARIIKSGEKDLNVIGEIIHREWLKRNDYAWGGDLDVPFAQLPPSEQKKDLDQYFIGLEKIKSLKK